MMNEAELTRKGMPLDVLLMEDELDAAFGDLAKGFGGWGKSNESDEMKAKFTLFAFFCGNGFGLATGQFSVYWLSNFYHYLFLAHTDGCRLLKPKLNGGE